MQISQLKLTSRAERLLCLAQIFLPPKRGDDFDALREQLCPDLTDITAELGEDASPVLHQLAGTLASIPDHGALLGTYSRLFLAPPAPALLSIGFYLDGGLMGNTCQAIEALYHRHGLARDADFRDTADHVALYLQFIAWTMAKAEDKALAADQDGVRCVLEDLNYTIVRHGLPAMQRLIAQIHKAERELPVIALYGLLATLVLEALLRDAEALQTVLPRPEAPGVIAGAELLTNSDRPGDSPASACTACGKAFVADAGLETMIGLLQAQGLSTDHMRICPECRASAMGLTAVAPPKLRKAS